MEAIVRDKVRNYKTIGSRLGATYKMGTESKFTFGKYKGQRISEVVKIDLDYICWLLIGPVHFTITKNLEDYITVTREVKWQQGAQDYFELQRQRYNYVYETDSYRLRTSSRYRNEYSPYGAQYTLPDGSDLYDNRNAHLDECAEAYWNLD